MCLSELQDEGIVLFAYTYVGKGGYQIDLPEDEVRVGVHYEEAEPCVCVGWAV